MTDPSENTPTSPEAGAGVHRDAPLAVAVGVTVTRLQAQLHGDQGDRARTRARAVLADLRRQAGSEPSADPLSLQRVLLTLQPTLREKDIGRGDAPSAAEEAAFHALSLFAVHMQSATVPMHRQRTSFAAACGQLYAISESQSMKPRFDALLLARSSRSRLIHARSMVTLLRGAGIGFDYGAFARDLYTLANPEWRSGVLLRWGRDFATGGYRARQAESDSATTNNV